MNYRYNKITDFFSKELLDYCDFNQVLRNSLNIEESDWDKLLLLILVFAYENYPA